MWPEARFQGSTVLESRERDGIFVTADAVNVVEVTASREKAKAQKDGEKLKKATEALGRRYPLRAVKGWFITAEEPTADQRDVIKRYSPTVVALSFSQFRSLLVDAGSYLDARVDYPFGSARGLREGDSSPGEYVDLDIAVEHRPEELWGVPRIVEELRQGRKLVLLGDYGAGKSMTLRQAFFVLAEQYRRKRTTCFPIYLNLRDHWGQSRAAEVLTRHAENVGFAAPTQLVRAWRSGYAIVLLDGFDELASVNWLGRSDRLREARRRAVQLIRTFVDETPRDTGLIIAGRQHYFDSEDERVDALGVAPSAPQLTLNDFTGTQVEKFLKLQGWEGRIPAWLPARPLLLGYLAARNLLEESLQGDSELAPAAGWDLLLDRISNREARIEAGLSGPTIRAVIERSATYARDSTSGLGPLPEDRIYQAFSAVTGVPPDEAALVLLQRLPGLGTAGDEQWARGQDHGARGFIDESLADVARTGDALRFLEDPFNVDSDVDPQTWQVLLGQLGVETLAQRWQGVGQPDKRLEVALRRAIENGWPSLAADVVRVILALRADVDLSGVYIAEAWIPDLDLTESGPNLAGVQFQHCVIQLIRLEGALDPAALPRFIACNIGLIEGVSSPSEIPVGIFDGASEIDDFGEPAQTTDALLGLPLPMGARVGLTVLRKLYLQRGTGRREAALYRGLDDQARRYVSDVLDVLRQEGLMVASKAANERVWLPVRGEGIRVRRLVAAPMASADPVLALLKEVSG